MNALVDQILDFVARNPWVSLLQLVITIFIFTRILSQFSSTTRSAVFQTGTRSVPRVPYWIPYFGNTVLFSIRRQSWLLDISNKLRSNVFGLRLFGYEYIVVTSPALQAVFVDPSTPVSTSYYDDLRRSRFFANRNTSHKTKDRVGSAINTYLTNQSRSTRLTSLLETHSYNYISPSRSWVDQAQWERSAEVSVVADKPILSVSASLIRLSQDFSAHVILSALLTTSFVEANPNFAGEFFSFSSSYSMFMTGLPYYIAPGLGPPALARERCLLALDGLVEAMTAEIDGHTMSGKGTGMLYDLDDVHPAVWSIVKQSKVEAKNSKLDTRATACEVLEVIWNITFSSVTMALWIMIYLFDQDSENRQLLEDIKIETKKVVTVVKPQATGLAFEDPPRLRFKTLKDYDDAQGKCPVLYGALLEVLRLEAEPEEYLTVKEDFILSADASPDPHSTKNPALLSNVVDRYQLRKGDRIYAAYGATNRDTYHWDRPRRFAPNRYGLGGGTRAAQPRPPKLRSTSHFDCVLESMYVVIALLSFYELDGVRHPGSKIVAGMGIPKDNLKVKISRRKL